VGTDQAFLLHPHPLGSLRDVDCGLSQEAAEQIETIAGNLPDLLEAAAIRTSLQQLPRFEMGEVLKRDERIIERAYQLYSYLASAWIHAPHLPASKTLPAAIAVPLVQLADAVGRPPILSYASYTLANWQKIDPAGEIRIDNLRLLQRFIHKSDAAWFTLIHVDIEARAAVAIGAIPALLAAAQQEDTEAVCSALTAIQNGLDEMMATLSQMPEGCHPHVYYHEVRPYIFGFDDVIYEGVAQYGGQPQTLRGETGAQSTIIPAIIRALGLQHQETNLTQHLEIMRDYMPPAHREFLLGIDGSRVRKLVEGNRENSEMRDSYNECIRRMLQFRRMHLRFAASYIANQSPDSLGTGGTEFMTWLQQLIQETESQLIIH
jgi:indoleamine 2,3-dioxygenase